MNACQLNLSLFLWDNALTKVDGGLDMLRRGYVDHIGRIACSAAGEAIERDTSIIGPIVPHHRDRVLSMELEGSPSREEVGALVCTVVRLLRVADAPGKKWLEELSIDCFIQARPIIARGP